VLPARTADGRRRRPRGASQAILEEPGREDLHENRGARDPAGYPDQADPARIGGAGTITIGQFYAGIRGALSAHPELFTGDPKLQITGFFFGPGEDIAVTDLKSAVLAIETIVEQGEGTPKAPTDLQNQIAHFYQFQQLSKGMEIVKDPASPLKFSFDPGRPLVIDDVADVIQMVDDPPLVTYDAADWRAEQLSTECDAAYSKLLVALHQGFNEKPDKVSDAVGGMFEFKTIVGELLQQRLTAGPNAGQFAGPRFKFTA